MQGFFFFFKSLFLVFFLIQKNNSNLCSGYCAAPCLHHSLHLLLLHNGHIVQRLSQVLLQLLDVVQEPFLPGGFFRGCKCHWTGHVSGGGWFGGGRRGRRTSSQQLLHSHVLKALQDFQGFFQLPEAPGGTIFTGLLCSIYWTSCNRQFIISVGN